MRRPTQIPACVLESVRLSLRQAYTNYAWEYWGATSDARRRLHEELDRILDGCEVPKTGEETPRVPISAKLRREVMERDGYRCVDCGSQKHLQVDHKLSVFHGGETEIDNLKTRCRDCNLAKGTDLPVPRRPRPPAGRINPLGRPEEIPWEIKL